MCETAAHIFSLPVDFPLLLVANRRGHELLFVAIMALLSGKRRFFGMRGLKLNIAVGVVAGLDFLLFGYDQGVMGALLTLDSFLHYFPEVDTSTDYFKGLSPAERYRSSLVQGLQLIASDVGQVLTVNRYNGRWLHSGMPVRLHSHDLDWQLSRAAEDDLPGLVDHGDWRSAASLIV